MTDSRVVSLAPSATATLAAMGAADRLVGVTHNGPLDADAHEPGDSDAHGPGDSDAHGPGDSDAADPTQPTPVGGWLTPDLERVAELDPDLVLTSDGLQAEIAAEIADRGFDVHHAEPTTLAAAIDSFAALGAAIGRPEAGEALASDARDRLAAVRETVADAGSGVNRPVVYCEEWSDPPMAAGNWVPDVVEAAGGRYPFLDAGERSREVGGDTVVAADPDHVVLHVCGHGERSDPAVVRERGWELDAPIHVVDDSLLNQPSPALIDGVETLARLLHPAAFTDATH